MTPISNNTLHAGTSAAASDSKSPSHDNASNSSTQVGPLDPATLANVRTSLERAAGAGQAIPLEDIETIDIQRITPVPDASTTAGAGKGKETSHESLLRPFMDALKTEQNRLQDSDVILPILRNVRALRNEARAAAGTKAAPDYSKARQELKKIMNVNPAEVDKGYEEFGKIYCFVSFVSSIVGIFPAVVGASVPKATATTAAGQAIFQAGMIAATPLLNAFSHICVRPAQYMVLRGSATIRSEDASLGFTTKAKATAELEKATKEAQDAFSATENSENDGEIGALGTAYEKLLKAEKKFKLSSSASEIDHQGQKWQNHAKLFRTMGYTSAAMVGYYKTSKEAVAVQAAVLGLSLLFQLLASVKDNVAKGDKQLDVLLDVLNDADFETPENVVKHFNGPLQTRCKMAAEYLSMLLLQVEQNIAEASGFSNKPAQQQHQNQHPGEGAGLSSTTVDIESGLPRKGIPARGVEATLRGAASVAKGVASGATYTANALEGSKFPYTPLRETDDHHDTGTERSNALITGGRAFAANVPIIAGNLAKAIPNVPLAAGAGIMGGIAEASTLFGTVAEGMPNFMSGASIEDNRAMRETLENDIATIKGLHKNPENFHTLSDESKAVLLLYMRTLEEQDSGNLGYLSLFKIRPQTFKLAVQHGTAQVKDPPEWLRVAGQKTASTFQNILGGPATSTLLVALTKYIYRATDVEKSSKAAQSIFIIVQGLSFLLGIMAAYGAAYGVNNKNAQGVKLRNKYKSGEMQIPVSAHGPFTLPAFLTSMVNTFSFKRDSGAYATAFGFYDDYKKAPKIQRKAAQERSRIESKFPQLRDFQVGPSGAI